jgi:hypothetical protein
MFGLVVELGVFAAVATVIGKRFRPKPAAMLFTALFVVVPVFIPGISGSGAILMATLPLSVVVFPAMYLIFLAAEKWSGPGRAQSPRQAP